MDEETKEKIEQIEEKVKRKLIKHRDNISEKDVKRLLNEARKQQDDIIRQRNIERVKQNEMMRKRLLEKKLAKVSCIQKQFLGESRHYFDTLTVMADVMGSG